MKFRPRWPLACLLLLFLVLLVRLLWTLGLSGDSWSLFADEWRQQIRSFTSWEIPVPYRTPAEQAAYWVAQTSEIDAAQQNPQAALGAAWMLDTPCDRYERRHYYSTDFKERRMSYLLTVRREWERDTLEAMADDFEPLARDACLTQSELATKLDPENKHLWRNRALLLFQLKSSNSHPFYTLIPRLENWQSTLNECARHDPDNALYDYLAAIYLWSISSQENEEQKVKILDTLKYQRAQQRLSAGLKKPFLKTGYTGEAATFDLLLHTPFLADQQLDLAQSRKGKSREQRLLVKLLNFLEHEFSSDVREKKYDSAAAHASDFLRISEQLSAENTYFYFANMKQIFELNGLAKMLNLQKADPNLLDNAEYKKFTEAHRRSLLEMYMYEEILNRNRSEPYPLNSPRFFQLALASATSMNLLLITLVCALLFGGLSWLGRDDPNFECVEMGVWRPLICWISGTAISLVLWGLFPAQIVPLQLQYTSLRWIYWIGYILFILGLLYLIHAVFPVGWDELFVMVCILSLPVWIVSQFTNLYQLLFNNPLVIITAIVLLLLAGMLARHYSQKFLSEKSHSYTVFFLCCGLVLLLAFITIPYGLNLARVYQIPANLKNPIYPVTWRSILGMHAIIGIPESNFELYDSPLNQVWLVWYWRAGELFCVFISLSLLCLWYLKRQSRMIDGGFPSILQNRKRFLLHHAGLSLTKSCVISALIFSLIYLSVIPAYLKPSEKLITKNYRKMHDKEVIRQETEALRAEIEADPKVMDRLRKQAEQSRKWFQEQPFPHETEDVL